jgi:hypothetical protein
MVGAFSFLSVTVGHGFGMTLQSTKRRSTMADITYCINPNCPFTDCERHPLQLEGKKGEFSFAALDGVCRRYIGYLIEINEEKDNG